MTSIQLGIFTPFISLPNGNILESDGIQREYRRRNGGFVNKNVQGFEEGGVIKRGRGYGTVR